MQSSLKKAISHSLCMWTTYNVHNHGRIGFEHCISYVVAHERQEYIAIDLMKMQQK